MRISFLTAVLLIRFAAESSALRSHYSSVAYLGHLRFTSALRMLPDAPTEISALKSRGTPSLYASTAADAGSERAPSGSLPPWLPAFLTAAIGGLLFGSDIGASSSVVRILGSGASEFGALDAFSLGQVASASLFGAMIASASLIGLGDKNIGRQLELRVAAALFTVGTLIQSLAGAFPLMMLGRVIYGLGIGTAMHVAPLYIAETSPDNLRGKLVSLKEAAIVLGIVAGYVAGSIFGGDENWRAVFESALPFEALMLLGSLIVPESPRWLALRGKTDEAVRAIQEVQGIDVATAMKGVSEMVRMSANTEGTVEDSSVFAKLNEITSSKYNMQALKIGVGLVLFQQLSGQPSVLYFANRIFEAAGLGYEAAVGIGLFKFAMTLLSANLVENPNYGRRSLLLYGNSIITASLVGLAALYAFPGADGPNQPAILACMLAFVGGYQIGFGPISWLVKSTYSQ